jgi:hypothetical protein
MTDNPVRPGHRKTRRIVKRGDGAAALRALLCASMVFSGCAERKRPSSPWATASVVRPHLSAPKSDGASADDETAREDPPELRLDLTPPTTLFPPSSQARPARPRVAAASPAAAEASKPETPFVVPQLSVEESSTAQQEANASLSAAEKSVGATRGKSLNAAQADMASKISGFIADARSAAANGDWPSARNLARKAQLLSEELAKSLE